MEQPVFTGGLADRYFAALRYRDFRWVWISAMCGWSAYWALIVARGVLVLDLSDSSAMVGLTTFAAMAPRFLAPPVAGFLADRFSRRNILAVALALSLLHNLVLTALAFSGLIEVWHLVLLSFFNGTVRAFQMNASQSLVPNLVPREHLMNAIALNGAASHGSRLVGPGLIAPLLLVYGPDAAFLFCTLFYLIGLVMVLQVRTYATGGVRRGHSVASGFAEGLRYVYNHPTLRAILILVALHCSLTMAFESIFPVFSRDELGAGGAGVSYLMMSVGAGGLVAVLTIAGVRSQEYRGHLLFITGAVSGASMLGLAASPNLLLACLAGVAMGASQASFMVIAGAMVQQIAPDALRGRISGINQINIGGTMAMVNLANGSLADAIGAPWVLAVMGPAFVVVMMASLFGPTLRGIYAAGLREPAAVAV